PQANVLDDTILYHFFFSSRRRHTRCYRDWSSDVCSSDLIPGPSEEINCGSGFSPVRYFFRSRYAVTTKPVWVPVVRMNLSIFSRSEERRVGKECRARLEL